VDTTPPVLTNLKAEPTLACNAGPCPTPIHVTFDAADALSAVVRAEYSLDAGPWQYIEPVGALSDSAHEHYDFNITVNAPGGSLSEHLLTVRAYDRHDNVGLAKTLFGSSVEAK